MSSRRVQSWVWWLLPLLVARALMPVGFMAQAQDGKLQMVFCSAGASQASTGHDDAGNKHSAAQNDFSCPFAQVAAAPLLHISIGATIAFIATAEILPQPKSPYYAAGPPRLDRARGPPHA